MNVSGCLAKAAVNVLDLIAKVVNVCGRGAPTPLKMAEPGCGLSGSSGSVLGVAFDLDVVFVPGL